MAVRPILDCLENLSEDEQLRLAMEESMRLSEEDGAVFQRRSPPRYSSPSRTTGIDLDEWRAMSSQEKIRLFPPNPEGVDHPHSSPQRKKKKHTPYMKTEILPKELSPPNNVITDHVKENLDPEDESFGRTVEKAKIESIHSNNDNTYEEDINYEKMLKEALEKSKLETIISEEEKTRIVIENSRNDFELITISEDDDDDNKKGEMAIQNAIKISLDELMKISRQEPVPPLNPPYSTTSLGLHHTSAPSSSPPLPPSDISKSISTNEFNISPSNTLDLSPLQVVLQDEDSQMEWALKASQTDHNKEQSSNIISPPIQCTHHGSCPKLIPNDSTQLSRRNELLKNSFQNNVNISPDNSLPDSAPILDFNDEDEQLAWAIQASQMENKKVSENISPNIQTLSLGTCTKLSPNFSNQFDPRENISQNKSNISPANSLPDFFPMEGLQDEEEQLAWALQASKNENISDNISPRLQTTSLGARPKLIPNFGTQIAPKVNNSQSISKNDNISPPGISDFPPMKGLHDEDSQFAWALQASLEDNKKEEVSDVLSVLTPDERMEMALRISSKEAQSSSAPPRLPTPLQGMSRLYENENKTSSPGRKRLVVIDGMNVGMAHGLHQKFSIQGLVLAHEYFIKKGNPVHIFLPRSKWTNGTPEDKTIITALEQAQILFLVQTKCYDDLFVIKHADENRGVILSNDRYRDVLDLSPEFKDQISNRTLQFTWVIDTLMIADDPFGRGGPSLDQILQH